MLLVVLVICNFISQCYSRPPTPSEDEDEGKEEDDEEEDVEKADAEALEKALLEATLKRLKALRSEAKDDAPRYKY